MHMHVCAHTCIHMHTYNCTAHSMDACLLFSQKYDAKVDLWSVGAVLYKCLVGQCGFYAVSVPIPF